MEPTETKEKAYLFISSRSVSVLGTEGMNHYQCLNVSGPQTCCKAVICSDPENPDQTNWSDSEFENPLGKTFSGWLPVCLFYGKKDGDIIELIFKKSLNTVQRIEIRQNILKNYVFSFQETLHEITASFGGVYAPIFGEKLEIPKLAQYAFIITTHTQYTRSIGNDPIDTMKFQYVKYFIEHFNNVISKKD